MKFPYTPQQLEWIEALESGCYTQAMGALQTDKGFCCLGVAADIYSPIWEDQCAGLKTHTSLATRVLPIAIFSWFNLRSKTGESKNGGRPSLAHLNDHSHTHKEIANVLRLRPQEYFTNPVPNEEPA